MTFTDRETFAALLEDFEALFNRTLRPGVASQYFDALKTFPLATVSEAAREIKLKVSRFPSIAEWLSECKRIVGRRARAAGPAPERAEPTAPPTWVTTAHIAILKAATRGLKVGDPAMRERALELALAELIELREEHNSPASVPRARLTAEQDRIARVLVRELAGEASTAEPAR